MTARYRREHLWGRQLKLVPTRVGNQPALVSYQLDPYAPIWRASSLVVLTPRETGSARSPASAPRGCWPASGCPARCPAPGGLPPKEALASE